VTMKAVLSNRVYMECSPELEERIEKELTYYIPNPQPDEPPIVLKTIMKVRDGLITIPIGRVDLIPKNYEIVDKRVTVPAEFPEFKFELRESQQAVYDALEDNCIINAWVSWGKTFSGLAIAGKLGQKTLIVTHTAALKSQWVRETEKVYGFTPDTIGAGQFKTSTPIVVATTQTLYKNIDKVKKAFGTLILDEMHHVSSPTFSKVVDSNYCRYKIGLSGTIERKDGKHVLFRDYFGHNIFKPPKENYLIPEVHIYTSDIAFPSNGQWASKVTALGNNEEYRHTIALIAAAYSKRGHKVLVVSDRVAFLEACATLIGPSAVCVTGKVTDREELLEQINYGDKRVLCGTQSIFSEGISLNSLSCLILATPINNEPLLTQLIGRIVRVQENKPTPVIIDIHLKGGVAKNQASQRLGHYMKEGYVIKQI
jgi:superfamily II DNA or RNA helicase